MATRVKNGLAICHAKCFRQNSTSIANLATNKYNTLEHTHLTPETFFLRPLNTYVCIPHKNNVPYLL